MEQNPQHDIAIWNAAMRCQGQPVGLRDGVLSVILEAVSAPASGESWFEAGNGLSLQLESCDFIALVGSTQENALEMESLAALPEELATALTRAALELLAQALSLSGRLAATATCLDTITSQCLRITMHRGTVELARVLACGSPAAMAGMLRGLGPLPGFPPAEIAALVPCAWHALSGGLTLKRAAIDGLCPGDALLHGPVPNLCRIMVGGRVVRAHKDETEWKIEALMPDDKTDDTSKDLPSTPQADTAQQDILQDDIPQAANFDDIPVRIDFRIARGQMTLAELGELTPGGILPMSITAPEPGDAVDILANGCKVGDGHLILIDERPAVRIARIFGSDGHG